LIKSNNHKKIVKHTFCLQTRLEKSNKLDEFLEKSLSIFSSIYRATYQTIRYIDASYNFVEHRKELQRMHNISGRMANTIIRSCKGRYEALKELKIHELKQLKVKITSIEDKIAELIDKVSTGALKASKNQLNEDQLSKYRNNKKKLFYLKQKLNKLKMKYSQREIDIRNNKLSLCFGTKQLFKAQYHLKENGFKNHNQWLKAYRNFRDKNIEWFGAKDEVNGNNECHLILKEDNNFNLRIRIPYFLEEIMETKWLEIENIDFKYQKDKIIRCLKEKSSPFTFRLSRIGRKIYLYLMITLKNENEEYNTTKFHGCVGLDFNKGFISLSETNATGNLVAQRHIPLRYAGSGNKAKTEMQQVISNINEYCLTVGKDLVIEDLNFKKTKSKKNKGNCKFEKEQNKMIHSFDYSRYSKLIENACFRNKINLIKVNPAYTSWLAKIKYCNKMKLSIHQGASFVIARKGQGFRENLKNQMIPLR
jgi:IS605 OrfB family transposase